MNTIAMPAMDTTTTTLAANIRHIPVAKLVPSKANVRRVNSTVGVSELADSIEAHGLIQNLTVRKAKKGDKYEVVAGARRLAALRLLVKEGIFAKIEQKIENIRDAAKAYDPAEQALAGCIVTIGNSGTLQIGTGYVKAEDRAELGRLQHDGEAAEEGNGDNSMAAVLEAEPETGYSATLIEELTAIRTAALRVELASRPEIAIAAILHPLLAKVFYDGPAFWRTESAIEVSGQRRDLAPSIKKPDACRALVESTNIKETWADPIPGNPGDLWEWLLEQRTERLTDLLAFVTAANLNAVRAKHDHSRERLQQAEQIAVAVNLDMRQFWTPEAMFLSRLSKVQIAEVMQDAGCSKDASKAVGKAPKVEAVTQAETALRGKSWLPAPLRAPHDDADDAEAMAIAAE